MKLGRDERITERRSDPRCGSPETVREGDKTDPTFLRTPASCIVDAKCPKVHSELRLVGERVALRPARAEDLEGFRRVFADPEVMRYVAYGRPLSNAEMKERVTRMIARFDADAFGQLAVARRADGALMGRAGLLPLDPDTWQSGSLVELGSRAEIEIGWTLAREFWGHGYATEAAVLVRDWAWRDLGLPRLVSIIQLGNDRSVRLAEKLGGRLEREITTSFGKRAQLFAYARPSDND